MKRLNLNRTNSESAGKWMIENIGINLISSGICFLIGVFVANYRRIGLFVKSLIHWNKDIRFSIAYLYKIKIDNKYLLIKGNKIEQLQPVGGVYKVYSSFNVIERKLNINFENERGFYEDGDLRFCTKGKNINKVLKWFKSRENREVAVYREFYEEIIKNNILPIKVLSDMSIEFLKQIRPKMTYSKHFKKNEILLFDIYEIHLTDKYREILCEYIEKENDLIKLVDREDIEKECVDISGKSFKIGAHSQYII
jgi:hypothetical protein